MNDENTKPPVAAYLDRHHAHYKLHFHKPLRTFADLQANLPFDPQAMVKALAFVTPSGSLIAALRASDKLDYKKLSAASQLRRDDIRAAQPLELEMLDCEPGGVAPFPMRGSPSILLDARAAELAIIYCGTGRADCTLEIERSSLLTMSMATVVDLAQAP